MSRPPAPHRLIASNYPDHAQITIRFADQDRNLHLNNLAIGQFYEEARVQFIHRTLGQGELLRAYRMLAAEVSIQYLKEGNHPGLLDVATGIVRIGRSSFVLGQALFQDGARIGTADVTMVLTDAGSSTSLPANLRRALEARTIVSLDPVTEGP